MPDISKIQLPGSGGVYNIKDAVARAMISGGVSSNVSGYYESRCKMISWNRGILMNHGCFDNAVKSLLFHAQRNDVLEAVGKMLELYLMEG